HACGDRVDDAVESRHSVVRREEEIRGDRNIEFVNDLEPSACALGSLTTNGWRDVIAHSTNTAPVAEEHTILRTGRVEVHDGVWVAGRRGRVTAVRRGLAAVRRGLATVRRGLATVRRGLTAVRRRLHRLAGVGGCVADRSRAGAVRVVLALDASRS